LRQFNNIEVGHNTANGKLGYGNFVQQLYAEREGLYRKRDIYPNVEEFIGLRQFNNIEVGH